jgi:hypothetical protein
MGKIGNRKNLKFFKKTKSKLRKQQGAVYNDEIFENDTHYKKCKSRFN